MTQLELDFDQICAEYICGNIDEAMFENKLSGLLTLAEHNKSNVSLAMAIATAS